MSRIGNLVLNAIPGEPPDIVKWAEQYVHFPKSVRSEGFKIGVTPWIREPLYNGVDDITRIVTFVKPVQTGGSALGEVLMLYWIMYWRGFLQYNWSNDKRALERWESRIEAILKACPQVAALLRALPRFDGKKCEVDFGKVFFRMQGVFVPDNLDSDSIALQINEEVHAWEPGHLRKARNRSTAVWNFKSVDISNAGNVGDQLHKAFTAGTQQYWEVKCPGCGLYHKMRTRWEDKKPELGGLRYNGDEARREGGEYDYNKIRGSVRYQMPCGYVVHNDPIERRTLSVSGQYGQPTNTGAELSHRSYTYEAVAVDYIDWVELIKQKHEALYSLRNGDQDPWRIYRQERECLFYDINDAPIQGGTITLSTKKKNRDGIKDPKKIRFFGLDRQHGEAQKQEFPHWWLAIRDVVLTQDGLKTLLVYEGRLDTDEEVIQVLTDHGCQMWLGVADTGHDTTHAYLFCLKHGINAIKGGSAQGGLFTHPGGTRRIWSPERPLHTMINREPKYPYVLGPDGRAMPDVREPLFWLYSKFGIRERLHWLRQSALYETPGDVSEEYQAHQEAEQRQTRKHPRTGEEIIEYVQVKKRNDQYVNECYIAMQIEMAGLIGAKLPALNEGEVKEKQ